MDSCAVVLLKLLRARFGELSQATLDRVTEAKIPVIQRWAVRAPRVLTLAQVFVEPS